MPRRAPFCGREISLQGLLLRCEVVKYKKNPAQIKEMEEQKMASRLKEMNVEVLFEAILRLKTMEECYNFFEDLCTVQELKALSQRLQVASMLSDGKVYSDIVAKTGASTATISRVNRSLNYGCDGYKVIFERLKEDGIL